MAYWRTPLHWYADCRTSILRSADIRVSPRTNITDDCNFNMRRLCSACIVDQVYSEWWRWGLVLCSLGYPLLIIFCWGSLETNQKLVGGIFPLWVTDACGSWGCVQFWFWVFFKEIFHGLGGFFPLLGFLFEVCLRIQYIFQPDFFLLDLVVAFELMSLPRTGPVSKIRNWG